MWEIIGIALTAIIALIVGFFVLLYSLSSGMRKTVKSFLDFIVAEEYSKAYQYLSEEIQSQVWEPDFEKYLAARYMTDIAEYRNSDFNVAANGSNGQFKTNLLLHSETIVPITLELMKFKGKWKIYSIDVHVRVADSVLNQEPHETRH